MATYSKDFIVKNGLQVGGTTLRVGDIILKDMGDNTMNVYQSDGTTLAAVITPSANVSYDNTASGLSATNVKAALDEIVSEQDGSIRTLLGSLDASIIPSADITYDLGSPTKQWRDLYIGPGSLYLNGTKVLEDDSGTLNFTADANQSMTLQTSGTGQTDITSAAGVNLSSTGTGADISLTAAGNIEVNSDLLILAGKSINTSDGNAVGFSVDADFGANSITATTVTANLTGNVTGTVSSLSNHDTDDVAEGLTNLYYTDARAQAAISTDSTLTYSSGQVSMPNSGVTAGSYGAAAAVPVITIDAQGRITSASTTAVAGVSSVSYTASTGVLQIDTSDGSSYTNDLGVGTGDSPTFAGLTVNGNLTVSGTTTTVNTETINLADNVILLNSNATGTPSENGGIEIERGDSTNKTLLWDEANDRWTVGSESFVAGTFIGALTGNVTGNVTGDVTGNADTASAWATARTLSLTGAVTGSASIDGSGNVSLATTATSDPIITLTGAVTGSATMTNLGNVSIATTATADPTLTINGDASGSATFTNLGNATLTLTIADDSHNHTIANIDGLQTELNSLASASAPNLTGDVTAQNMLCIGTSGTPRLTGQSDVLEIHGATSSFHMGVQDGTGRIQMRWNASKGTSPTYLVSNEASARFEILDVTSPGTDLWKIDYAAAGTAGNAISYSNVLSVGTTTFTYNGTMTATDFNSTSDERLKTKVETISNPKEKVAALRGVNFEWIKTGEEAMGVIAQEVEEVIPEVVATNAEGMKSVNYQAMVGLLIEAVKDLQAQVDDLKNNK